MYTSSQMTKGERRGPYVQRLYISPVIPILKGAIVSKNSNNPVSGIPGT